ncbi:unnamed protein product [Allacma fusca]|uniref:Uncharacterized protein n=1 Tax=Allacma fusca TaxID=39272 RepID=A0A8J2PVB2_9HEXA|nr:unnamed protein product [Allacma fusca]
MATRPVLTLPSRHHLSSSSSSSATQLSVNPSRFLCLALCNRQSLAFSSQSYFQSFMSKSHLPFTKHDLHEVSSTYSAGFADVDICFLKAKRLLYGFVALRLQVLISMVGMAVVAWMEGDWEGRRVVRHTSKLIKWERNGQRDIY